MTRWLLLLAFALVLAAAYAKQEEENVDLEEVKNFVKELKASDLSPEEKDEKFLGFIGSIVHRVTSAAHTLVFGRRRRRRRRHWYHGK